MAEDSHTRRYTVGRRALLASTAGIVGTLSGCGDNDNSPEEEEPTNDSTPKDTDDGQEDIPPTVANSHITDDYAYLTVNDEHYYDYFQTEFVNRLNYTTEFTPEYGALRVNIPEGSHYGSSMWFLPEKQWNDRCDELHIRYWIYVPDDFTIENQLKLPSVGNRKSQGWGGRKSDGTGGWSSHIALNEGSEPGLEFYTYHADMSGDYGDIDKWDKTIPTEEWSQLDFYVDVNTPGKHDGVIRGWLNNEFGHERTGLMFRKEGYTELNIDEIWFTIYHGGQATSPKDNFLVLGDHELWKDHGEQID